MEIVDCNPVRAVNVGVVVDRVTARPADEACIAGELERDVVTGMRGDGDALALRLATDGECRGGGPAGDIDPIFVDGEGEELCAETPAVDGE